MRADTNKPIVQNSCVHTRHVHNSLQTYTCMSGMHMPNFDCVHSGINANCKPRTAVQNSMNSVQLFNKNVKMKVMVYTVIAYSY